MPGLNSIDHIDNTEHKSISRKKRAVALVLCVFGGLLGLHQFYAGNDDKGRSYIRTCGRCGFGWVADIFFIAAGVFEDVDGLPIVKWW